MIANQLHIRLECDGVERMRLALPTRAAERLSRLMPPQLAEEVRVRGVDLRMLEDSVRNGDLSPRALVDYQNDEGRHISIWLE
jgi:hypothetical protein